MSEAIETAISGNAPVVPPQAAPVVEPELTQDSINDALRSGDLKGLKRIQERLMVVAATPAPESTEIIPELSQQQSPSVQPSEQAPEAKKTFTTRYKGVEYHEPNENGLLGEKDFNGVLKKVVHQKLYIKDVETERDRLRQERIAEAEENKRMKAEHVQLNQQLEQMRETAKNLKPTAPAPAAEVTRKEPVQDDQIPEAPKKPSKKLDVIDDESVTEWDKYYENVDAYNSKISAILRNQKPQVIYQTDEATRKDVEDLKRENLALKSVREQQERERIAEEQERNINAAWDKREKFVESHPELKPTKALKELHEEVVSWADKIAHAMSIEKPKTDDPNELALYNQLKGTAVYRYLHGDKEVLDKAEGFDPPADYDKYFKVADLESDHQKFISQGQLGNKSSLNDAFLIKMAQDGTLDNVLEAAEVRSVSKGANAVLDTLKKNQEQFATTIPSGMQQTSPTTPMTEEEETAILGMNATQLQANPELYKKRNQIMKRLGYDVKT
jgi:hypothetical protein